MGTWSVEVSQRFLTQGPSEMKEHSCLQRTGCRLRPVGLRVVLPILRERVYRQVECSDLQLDDVARRRDGTSRYLCKHVAPSSSHPASCLLAPHHLKREGATADGQTQTDQVQTQKAMEVKTLANVRSALETGTLIDLVPEQAGL